MKKVHNKVRKKLKKKGQRKVLVKAESESAPKRPHARQLLGSLKGFPHDTKDEGFKSFISNTLEAIERNSVPSGGQDYGSSGGAREIYYPKRNYDTRSNFVSRDEICDWFDPSGLWRVDEPGYEDD